MERLARRELLEAADPVLTSELSMEVYASGIHPLISTTRPESIQPRYERR